MRNGSKNSLEDQRNERRQLMEDLRRTKERISEEDDKDIMEQDHAQLAWLINHKEWIINYLNGKLEPDINEYKIAE